MLQIIVCQCYLKLFARTRECFARLVVLASSTRIYYILKTPFLKGSPISSGGPASLDSPWNGETHRSFLITNLYDTTSLYGYDSKFHKWCLSRGMTPLNDSTLHKAILCLHPRNAVYYMIWLIGKQVPVSCGIIKLFDEVARRKTLLMSQVLKCIFISWVFDFLDQYYEIDSRQYQPKS